MCSVGCGCDQCLRRCCISSLRAQSLFTATNQHEQSLEDYLGYDVMTGTSFLDPSGDVSCAGTKRKGYDSSVSFRSCTADRTVLD